MKKNILLLINGFGVEKNDSYNVYSPELMPNMDKLTKERIFTSISNNFLDYKSAYRNFSMGINDALTYSLIENNISSSEQSTNQLLRYITNETNKYNSRLHVICYWDSDRTIDQLLVYLREIGTQTKARIFIHVVLCQKSINDYKDIERKFTALSYDSGPNTKVGIVTGENNLYNYMTVRDLVKNFMTEAGEKWKDIGKKIEVLTQTKTIPCNTRTFSVNAEYKFEENDQILLFNYNNIDISLFRTELYNQKYREINLDSLAFYSLFPAKAEKSLPFMYNFAVSANYALNSLKSIGAKCIIFDKKDNCSYINYYMTGLRNTIDESLKYLPTDDDFIYDSNRLLETFKTYNKELTIINYEIDSCKTIEEMKDRLKKIDEVIGVVDSYCRENNIGLFITSLYGIEKEMYNQKQELCKINFSGRAPLIISDSEISTSNYSIVEGSLYDLSNSIYWNINKQYNISGIIKKKSSLLSIFYKKPKGDKK